MCPLFSLQQFNVICMKTQTWYVWISMLMDKDL